MFESNASGVALAAALESTQPETMTDEQLRDALRGSERLTGWTQARQLAVLAEVARRDDAAVDGDLLGAHVNGLWDRYRFVADEVSAELAIPKTTAMGRVQLGVALERLPATRAGLRAGRIDLPKAQQIVEQLSVMQTPDAVAGLEAAAVEYGCTHTRPQLRAWLARRVIAAEPGLAETRRQEAQHTRRVCHYPGTNGISTLLADLPATDALAMWRMIDHVAQTSRYTHTSNHTSNHTSEQDHPSDGRSIDQRRADALVDLVLGVTQPTTTTEVLVTMTAETLAGTSTEPGELVGYGPITATHARELAQDARWRRLLTDPTGHLLEVSPTTYRPSKTLTRYIKTRDLTCRFPGCRRTTTGTNSGTDLDHTTPFPHGLTTPDNLAVLCRSHHQLKTHTDWKLVQLPGAIMKWTTPTGHTFHTHPATHPHNRGDPPLRA